MSFVCPMTSQITNWPLNKSTDMQFVAKYLLCPEAHQLSWNYFSRKILFKASRRTKETSMWARRRTCFISNEWSREKSEHFTLATFSVSTRVFYKSKSNVERKQNWKLNILRSHAMKRLRSFHPSRSFHQTRVCFGISYNWTWFSVFLSDYCELALQVDVFFLIRTLSVLFLFTVKRKTVKRNKKKSEEKKKKIF